MWVGSKCQELYKYITFRMTYRQSHCFVDGKRVIVWNEAQKGLHVDDSANICYFRLASML